MKSKLINVVLCGGSGTRLWPLSRQSKPKQFLQLFNGKSLFQHTLMRNGLLVDDIMLVTNQYQNNIAIQQAQDIGEVINNSILEPVGRNTAPAITLAALSCNPDDILIVTPSDHMIEDDERYKIAMESAIELAKQDYIVTFGIEPTNPNIGYGYIEHDIEDVLSFREKPDLKKAKEFIEVGNFLWNSGMFCFKASTFLYELKKFRLDIFDACIRAHQNSKDGNINLDLMNQIPEDSIDYAVLEKSKKIKTVPSEFYWTDLGTFDAIIDYFENGGEVDGFDNNNTQSISIFSDKKVFSTVDDLIIIDTEECIVILKRNESNSVKEIFQKVKQKYPHLTS